MRPAAPRAAVVVPTRDRADRLERLLSSLRTQDLPPEDFEVVVVDDGSTDGTRQLLEREATREGPALRVIRNEESGGVAAARNAGWRSTAAPAVAFIDDDCVATPGWLRAGLRRLSVDGDVFVQGKTEPAPDELHKRGPFTHTLTIAGAGPHFETCNIFYPRALLERLGGFDAAAFPRMGGADADLGWRAKGLGADPVYEPRAQVHHAVLDVGPLGQLRYAARWTDAIQIFARHPELRRTALTHRFFWRRSHYQLTLALLALALPGPLARARSGLLSPYLLGLRARVRERHGGPALALFLVVFDLVEMVAVARGAIRYRVAVL